MRKFYQENWFGIDFKSFAKLDSKNMADVIFYDKFYDSFYRKYKSYAELPELWRESKKLVADLILKQTGITERLLSIGCGSGYIEYLLRKEGRKITAIEPSIRAPRFLKQFSDTNLYEGYFPDCLINAKEEPFDLAYMSGTEYCFNKQELDTILKQICNYGVNKFLLVSASWYNSNDMQLYKGTIKIILSLLKLYELGQFWGYQRTPKEFAEAFSNAGFKDIEYGCLQDGQYWIKGVKR